MPDFNNSTEMKIKKSNAPYGSCTYAQVPTTQRFPQEKYQGKAKG